MQKKSTRLIQTLDIGDVGQNVMRLSLITAILDNFNESIVSPPKQFALALFPLLVTFTGGLQSKFPTAYGIVHVPVINTTQELKILRNKNKYELQPKRVEVGESQGSFFPSKTERQRVIWCNVIVHNIQTFLYHTYS